MEFLGSFIECYCRRSVDMNASQCDFIDESILDIKYKKRG